MEVGTINIKKGQKGVRGLYY